MGCRLVENLQNAGLRNKQLFDSIVAATSSLPGPVSGRILYPKIGTGNSIKKVHAGKRYVRLSTIDGCADNWVLWMNECQNLGLFKNSTFFDYMGGYMSRYKKNGTTKSQGVYGHTITGTVPSNLYGSISNHAFGNAADFMPAGRNGYKCGNLALPGDSQCLLYFIEVGAKYNWRWGGAYHDNMHFEYVGGVFGGKKSTYTGGPATGDGSSSGGSSDSGGSAQTAPRVSAKSVYLELQGMFSGKVSTDADANDKTVKNTKAISANPDVKNISTTAIKMDETTINIEATT